MPSPSSLSRSTGSSVWRRSGTRAVSIGFVAAVFLSVAPVRAGDVGVRVLGGEGEGLAGAVFSAIPLDDESPAPPEPAVMDQRDKSFVPRILPVQTGAEVTFSNNDSISHHVYSFSPAKRFEIYLSKGESHGPLRFEKAGVAALGCNIHDWMLGYVLVVDTPYFIRTDGRGRGRLEGLPAGRYRLELWHPRIADEEEIPPREVELEESGRESWQVQLQEPLLPARTDEPGFVDY